MKTTANTPELVRTLCYYCVSYPLEITFVRGSFLDQHLPFERGFRPHKPTSVNTSHHQYILRPLGPPPRSPLICSWFYEPLFCSLRPDPTVLQAPAITPTGSGSAISALDPQYEPRRAGSYPGGSDTETGVGQEKEQRFVGIRKSES